MQITQIKNGANAPWVDLDPSSSARITKIIASWEAAWSESTSATGSGIEIWLKDSSGHPRRLRKVSELEMVEVASNFDLGSTTVSYNRDPEYARWVEIAAIAESHIGPESHIVPSWSCDILPTFVVIACASLIVAAMRLRYARQKG